MAIKDSVKSVFPLFPILLIISFVANLLLGFSLFKSKQKQYFVVSRVVDGDTFQTKDSKYIRLLGINAPELGRCGFDEAKNELEELILNKNITLSATTSDAFNRPVADVYNEKGESINVAMVVSGWAVYDSSDSKEKVKMKEAGDSARKEKAGVFGEKCSPTINPVNKSCTIKGNVDDATGRKRYNFPGCAQYDRTVVDLYLEDQWFCTEAEAIKAGFTKSENCFGKKY